MHSDNHAARMGRKWTLVGFTIISSIGTVGDSILFPHVYSCQSRYSPQLLVVAEVLGTSTAVELSLVSVLVAYLPSHPLMSPNAHLRMSVVASTDVPRSWWPSES
jgi:hypothetical protein